MLKDEVLYALEQQRGTVLTGGRLAASLGVSRTAIWKAIHVLQEEGNEIIALPNSGYKLVSTNDTLVERVIRDNLTTEFIGRNMAVLSTVSSTNQYLKEADTAELPNGFAVIADEQTQGRGRRGREFVSPKNAGIYVSLLLKPGEQPGDRPDGQHAERLAARPDGKPDGQQHDLRLLTICSAVAVSRAIEKICGIQADIKWVNDVFCKGKKICGILTEASLSGELQEITTVIVGIGVNTGKVPSKISGFATSIEEVAGMRGVRNRLAAEILNQFEAVYLDFIERGAWEGILAYYESRLFIKGWEITVIEAKHRYQASVLGVDDSGALIVQDKQGKVLHVSTGEIELDRGTHE